MMEQEQTNNKKVYFRIIAIIVAIVMVFLGFKLYKISELDRYKNLLQEQFDRQYQNLGRGSFCYEVGNIKLPYVDKGYPAEFKQQYKLIMDDGVELYEFPNFRKDENSYQLNLILPIFYDAGLLERERVEGTDYYQYDITEEGKKYQSEYDNKLLFCYGYQKVLEVTDITKRDSFTYKGKQDVIVIYNYELDEVPSWLNNKHFIEVYSRVADKNRTGREVFIEKDGNIFIDGEFNNHIYGPSYSVE